MAERVLVTGGAGFIGSHIVDLLLRKGYEVRVIDSLEEQVHGAGAGKPHYLNSEAEFIHANLLDEDALTRALSDVDIISHQASLVGVGQSMYELQRYTSGNDLATAALLEKIVNESKIRDRVKKIVCASSMSIYGEGKAYHKDYGEFMPAIRNEEQYKRGEWDVLAPNGEVAEARGTDEGQVIVPTSIYAANKLAQEHMTMCIGNALQIPSVALRYFGVYGSRQSLSNPYTGVGAIFCSRILNGNAPIIYEDGEQTRDFIHVSDIARANLLAIENVKANFGSFNVGTGRIISIKDLAKLLIEKIGAKNMEPEINEKFRAGDIRHCYADLTRSREILGYEPQVTLEQGVEELIESVRSQAPVDAVSKAHEELEKRGLTR